MISTFEKEMIVAYFQGGNAKEMGAAFLKEILEVIKEACKESKVH